jgi:hypothetical protein
VATITPTSLAFPNVPLGTASTPQVVTITNTGSAPLAFTGIAITGTVPTDFSETTTCTGSIAIKGTCTISVTFSPSTIENQTGTVTITDNAANSSQSVPITANGAIAAVFLSPDTLTFPSQAVWTTSSAQTITVENYGNLTLSLSSVTITGPFVISANTCGTSLTAGATCVVSVEFKPTASGTAVGGVSFTDNAEDARRWSC